MKKLTEHTYGTHIYMKMELNNNIEEIDVYLRENGTHYRTTGDHDKELRKEIITAFKKLY